ncbi:unnamed protein product [Lactuca virosa]|uniref:PAZ domain-containing protein n=1 Tax=Lactuca virosa TaxID=75947 RepID=A0AAU9PB02_9ASTR|nr:unnamed protein product [Lactuca virosa]
MERFSLRQKSKDENGEFETLEVTVYDYFVNYRKIELQYSGELLCVNVGKPKRPTFFPLEALSLNKYDEEPLLKSCVISINNNFTQVESRGLAAPKKIDEPFDAFEESPQNRRAPPLVRVKKMFEMITSKLHGALQFLLCLLPERKNSDFYGPSKKKNLADFGIVIQCIAPMRVNDQYLTNVLLKINAKVNTLEKKTGQMLEYQLLCVL